MILALTIIHIVISVVLILTVLLQHGKQQGLSGAIAGGAETFFGKNKGRTIDSMLKKFTAVFAVLFVVTSLSLAAISASEYKSSVQVTEPAGASAGEVSGEQALSFDENGNLVDAEGNVVATTENIVSQEVVTDEAAATEEVPAE